jgi:glycosyltransferase involved in cell wall biosynthesis
MDSPRVRASLDGIFLSQPATGSGQYTLQLWRHLCHAADGVEVSLLRPEDGTSERSYVVRPPGIVRSPKALKLWWEQVGVVRAMRLSGADLLHIPYMAAPRMTRLRTVVTIHDVIPLIFRQYGGSVAMRLYLRLVVPAARRASLILTDSECSRRDIVRLLGIDQNKVRSIPLAASDEFHPEANPEGAAEMRQRLDLNGPVLFNVGGLDVRKNVSILVEAFARALPEIDPETRLVIGGQPHTGNSDLYPALDPILQRFGLNDKVRLPGRISDEEKRLLYQISTVYVYPSLYEGFGLTPLEAMACGLPVISSNRSSLPEVVGTGGLLVEPTPGRLAAAMVSILNDEHLHRDLSQRALDQAARFSWRKTAEQTRNAYRDVVGMTPSA